MSSEPQRGIQLHTALPWSVIIYLATQTVAVVIWGARIDARIDRVERDILVQEKKLNDIDERGTRKLTIIEDRQNMILRRLEPPFRAPP